MKNLIYLFMPLFFLNCSPKFGADWTKPDYTSRTFNKIAVVGISKDLKARTDFESTATELLKKQGINAVEGISIFPANMKMTEKNQSELLSILKKNKVDGIIAMSLIDSEESQKFQSGQYQNIDLGYYRVGRYLVRRYTTIQEPDYYVTSKSYLIEAILYDLKGNVSSNQDRLVWRGQSKLVDPSSSASAAKSFSKQLVGHLIEKEIIQK